MMRAFVPSVQYATPRPTLRGAFSKRSPSSGLHVHSVSPVPGFTAITFRRCPTVKYNMPFAMSGVVSLAPPPKLSNFQLHATWRSFTLSRVIRSYGAYRVPPLSPAYERHSPALAPCWALPGIVRTRAANTVKTRYRSTRDIEDLRNVPRCISCSYAPHAVPRGTRLIQLARSLRPDTGRPPYTHRAARRRREADAGIAARAAHQRQPRDGGAAARVHG